MNSTKRWIGRYIFCAIFNSIKLIGRVVIQIKNFPTDCISVEAGSHDRDLWLKLPTICQLSYLNRKPADTFYYNLIGSDKL